MKPDWDKLTDDFKDSPTSGVYDVDCTAGGKDLCETHEVRGYPTIMWGEPDKLQDYQGGRGYDELKEFADENLGPQCSAKTLDLCDDEMKVLIESFLGMPAADLKAKIKDTEKTHASAEKAYMKRRRKFDAKLDDWEAERDEEESQLKLQKKEEEKFEKNKASMSKAEIAKREKKMEKAKKRAEKFEKKRVTIEEEMKKYNEEGDELDKQFKKTGYKHMKAILKQKEKEEL